LAVPVGVADQKPALFFASRTIPSVELPVDVPSTPIIEVTLTLTPTQIVVPSPVPSPTPDLNQIAPSAKELPIPPMALGGVLAAIIIGSIFGGKYLANRIRYRAR
jgi:hypothetical protein